MVSPPASTRRRALIVVACLALVLAGILAAVWGAVRALGGGPPPGLGTVAEATRLDFPDGTVVVDADLSQMQSPTPGDHAEVTVDIPSAAFDDFLAANGMEAPLLAGTTPTGDASGIIPAACGPEACWAATFVVTDDAVTVDLAVTLL